LVDPPEFESPPDVIGVTRNQRNLGDDAARSDCANSAGAPIREPGVAVCARGDVCGKGSPVGTGYSAMTEPAGLSLRILLPRFSANQTFPSGLY
jgi:hypothetical protein